MVDLTPKSDRIVTHDAPRPSLSAQDFASPYNNLAKALDSAGAGLTEVSKPLAEEAGYRAVTRDAEGNVQVARFPIVGPAGAHFERAVKVGAVAQAEGDAQRDLIGLRQQFRDDPEGYRKAAEGYIDKLTKQYQDAAGPAVGLAIKQSVQRTTNEAYRGLLSEKEWLELHRASRSIHAQIGTTENELYALARGGDTSSPEFRERVAKIEQLRKELTDNPRLAYPKEQADADHKTFMDELRVNGIAHHIVDQVYAKEGYDAALKAAASIKTDPRLNLSPGQRDNYYNKIVGELNAKARDGEAARNAVSAEVADINKQATQGYPVPPERMAQAEASVAATNNPLLRHELDVAKQTVQIIDGWRRLNPAELEGQLAELDKRMRAEGVTPHGLELKKSGEKLLKEMRGQVGENPLGWSDRTGLLPVPKLDFASPDIAQQMRDRTSRAEVIAKKYGQAPVYLLPEEKERLEQAANQGGEPMLRVAKAVSEGFGDRAPKVMAEISGQAPVMAHVGALLHGNGSLPFAFDVAEAVKLQNDKEFKLPKWLDHPSDKILTAQNARTREVYGDVFTLNRDTGRTAEAAAQKAFFARANRKGYDALLEQKDSKEAYDRALQEGAGARYRADGTRFGGVGGYRTAWYQWTPARVLVPSNVKSDSFGDAIGAIRDDDLKALPVPPQASAGDLRKALPVAVPGGYRFAMGDPTSDNPKFVQGADGKHFVLDFDKLEPELRKRVPGAFLGGR